MSEENVARPAWFPLAAVVATCAVGLAGCGGGGGGSTAAPVDLSHANLQGADLPHGWKPAAAPQDSLAKHVFVCLTPDLLGSNQPTNRISATGPGQLKMNSDVLGWPSTSAAQSATAELAQGSVQAKSCVGSSLHFAVAAFGYPRSPPRLLAGGTKESAAYAVSGQTGTPRGVVGVTTRGRATSVILAYRTGNQPFPPNLLFALGASASKRLAEATPGD
jgi:hypothetical protein